MTDDQSLDEASTMKENRTSEEISADKHYKNAFHVFRALCKLSDREVKDKSNVDPRSSSSRRSRRDVPSDHLETIWI